MSWAIRVPHGGRSALVGYTALAALVALWAVRAFNDPGYYDFGGFYIGGAVAWMTGHPEHLSGWTGTPLFAVSMAIASRISIRSAADLLIALNVVLTVGTVTVVLRRLRGTLSHVWWWITALALLTFGPVMSTVWWKQVNIIPLVLALAGFDLVRRHRAQAGPALIGLSVAFKPLAILLPFVLLIRGETRRAGAWALGYVVVLTVGAQVLLGAHAGSASALNPLISVRNFASKTGLAPGGWGCWAENFAPGSLLCRLGGTQDPTFQRVVVYLGVLLLGLWVVVALRGTRATSWEVFAFTCAMSPLLSPIEWSHYQIMLAPLFVLLVVRFTREGAGVDEWAGLTVAFVLASLMWRPYDTPIDVSRLGLPSIWTPFATHVADVAQFAQYVLIVTGVLWYRGDRKRAWHDSNVRPSAPEADALSPELQAR